MTASSLARLRKVCLALPETTEVKAWGEPTFRVRGRLFAMYASAANHHGGGRESVWLNCDGTNQLLMIADRPDRFFKPAFVGPYGWVGVYLDRRVSWKLVKDSVLDAYEFTLARMRAKRARLTGRRPRKRRT